MNIIDHIVVKVNVNANSETESGIIYRIKNANEAYEAVEWGIVEHIPKGCEIPIGSKLYFHRSVTMNGTRMHLEDDLYLVPYTDKANLTFGYIEDGDVILTGDYSLLIAKKVEEEVVNGLIVPKMKGYDGYVEDIAIMVYPTESCEVSVGNVCYLQPRRCYMIEIEGQGYWAVQDEYLLGYAESL